MSYKFVFHFMITISKQQLFLKMMYKSISQLCVKYKLLKFPLDCDLEKELLLFFLIYIREIQIWNLVIINLQGKEF